ncbi:MAG: T9SS type A sorting domain-containing protein [Bacteroidales bacterium]|nr:T9SS type A sorting domain-containing protein [Bacteroidales bacterium]
MTHLHLNTLFVLVVSLTLITRAMAQTSLEYDGKTSLKLFSNTATQSTVTHQQTDTIVICSSQTPFRWHGQNYFHTGRYSWLSTNGDSAATLILTVRKPYERHTHRIVCGAITQYGLTLPPHPDKNGEYLVADTLEARNGCDSIVVLHLKVDSIRNTTLTATVKRDRLPYLWNGRRLRESGTYTWTGQSRCGCDSIVTLVLDIEEQDYDYDEEGMFFLSPSFPAIGERTKLLLNLPTAERDNLIVEILSQDGTLFQQLHPNTFPIYITAPSEKGLYIVRVTTNKNTILHGKIVVK